MTYDGRDVTCRETTAGHRGVFGDVAPLRCVLGNPGWTEERDSYLAKGKRCVQGSNTTFEQNRNRTRATGSRRNPLNIDRNGILTVFDRQAGESWRRKVKFSIRYSLASFFVM